MEIDALTGSVFSGRQHLVFLHFERGTGMPFGVRAVRRLELRELRRGAAGAPLPLSYDPPRAVQ